jgi:hypothetical protein
LQKKSNDRFLLGQTAQVYLQAGWNNRKQSC